MTPHAPPVVVTPLVSLLLLVGCATAPDRSTDPARADRALEVATPGDPFGERRDARGVVSAADLRPGPPSSTRWVSVAGVLAGEEFDVATTPVDGRPGGHTTRTADLETSLWAESSDGSLHLERVDAHPDNARSLFRPPLLIAPPHLDAGEDATSEAAMRVMILPGATSERERGTATRTLRYVRDEWIRVDGTAVEAQVVAVQFVAKLKSARVERNSELFIVPGKGIQAERWSERLVVLGLFPKDSSQTAQRLGVEIAPPPAADSGSSPTPAEPAAIPPTGALTLRRASGWAALQ